MIEDMHRWQVNLENELGWKADENFDTGIVKTISVVFQKNMENNLKCSIIIFCI